MSFRVAIYGLAAAVFLVVASLVFCLGTDKFDSTYEDKLRASLFTGLFTLSGFLLSAKTFIILNLKKEVYSTETYIRRVRRQSPLATDGHIEVYRPLRNIGEVLTTNVMLCLGASILQFTLGLTGHRWAIAICAGAAAAAISLLCVSLWIISGSLREMYTHFEQEAQDKVSAK